MSRRSEWTANLRRQVEKAKDESRGATFYLRLLEAHPVGRTLASIAEGEGWTPGEARRAVAAAREDHDAQIVYAPDSRTFYWVAADSRGLTAD